MEWSVVKRDSGYERVLCPSIRYQPGSSNFSSDPWQLDGNHIHHGASKHMNMQVVGDEKQIQNYEGKGFLLTRR